MLWLVSTANKRLPFNNNLCGSNRRLESGSWGMWGWQLEGSPGRCSDIHKERWVSKSLW